MAMHGISSLVCGNNLSNNEGKIEKVNRLKSFNVLISHQLQYDIIGNVENTKYLMVFFAFNMLRVSLNVHLHERIEKIIYCQIFMKFMSEVDSFH